MDPGIVRAVLEDWKTAPVGEKQRAALGFLEKLTLRPAELAAHDVAPLRAAGIPGEGIEELVRVCACFNVITRVADVLGFDVPSAESFDRGAVHLLRWGYK